MSETTKSGAPRVVIDTNVLYAALRSNVGASFQVLERVWDGRVKLVIGHTVLAEYEEILTRNRLVLNLGSHEIGPLLDALCVNAELTLVDDFTPLGFQDPDDEAFGRLALVSHADFIVTHNVRDFIARRPTPFKVLAPKDFLAIIKA